MYRLLKLAAFACCVTNAVSLCIVSKYIEGPREWLKCSNSSISEVKSNLKWSLASVTISNSVIPQIPNLAFAQNATTVENLNFHDCGISQIANEAFRGLVSLKKLSLSYNNLVELNATWFYDLISLETLDVSFNKISKLDPRIYLHLAKLQRFDINDNALREIPLENINNMNKLKEIRIQENPITYLNRAQLTLLLKHRKVNWKTNDDNIFWLNDILWQCLTRMPKISSDQDRKMNICVLSKMFTQLSTLLIESPTKDNSTTECVPFRKSLAQCLKRENVKTTGEMLTNLLALTHDAAGLSTDLRS